MSEANQINQTITNAEQVASSISGDVTIYNYHYYSHQSNKSVPNSSDKTSHVNLTCPYRGLHHFSPQDAEYFFGRDVFVDKLINATKTKNFISVLGASGSGKSSVILAGLVPKLQEQGNWQFTHFRPGIEPFHALAEALVPLYEPDKDATEQMRQARKLSRSLIYHSILLQDVFIRIQNNYPDKKLLLIVDQFEELYTLCNDDKIRCSFLDCILKSCKSSVVIVATMRADFLGNALTYRPLADKLQNNIIMLGAMNREELTQVIEQPAKQLDINFQEGLIERILNDIKNEPGNLPLLEFALTLLWENRTEKQLTHAAYQAIGQVQGALTLHANETYNKLTQKQQEQAKKIFIQLVLPGDKEDTRRVATKRELGDENWDLVTKLADARLVVTSVNSVNQENVEVVHETIIHHWDKLREWINKDRDFRLWQERLRVVMRQWENTQRDKSTLLRGVLLAEAEEKLKERGEELRQEQEFIEASLLLQKEEYKQHKATQLQILMGKLYAVMLAFFALILLYISKEPIQRLTNEREQDSLAEKIADITLVPGTEKFSVEPLFLTKDEIWLNRYSYDSKNKEFPKGLIRYNFKNKQPKSYFDNKSVTSVLVENRDIWAGIAEENGKNVKYYILHGVLENGLLKKKLTITVSSLVTSLVMDKNKRLWVGTYRGVCLIKSKSQQCQFMKEINSACSLLAGEKDITINKIILDQQRNLLWIAANRGLIRWYLDSKTQFSGCLLDKNDDNREIRSLPLPDNLTTVTIDSRNQNIWVGSDQGFVKYFLEGIKTPKNIDDKWKTYTNTTEEIITLIQIKEKFFLAGTGSDKTFLYSTYTNKWIPVKINIKESLNKMVLTDDGYLWIGTDRGLYQTKLSLISNANN
ncbi:two-component regulator propeller domain-containing protein [Cronbergia sp. UHCC 0137]|uniref:nSTAND1 domain-containing NTPase n=1 Tax=Cronbergia sp. UHCC 0137 TaxID=3110239 RepID=UPI002B20F3CD|nr:two-component regulator propeller domain-containing protein [Cronbergia sp. UHCC 0137]MEA5618363.1 two-component regulator propeller domain-containing protein [Cronbergia sp. UHCC 0137]